MDIDNYWSFFSHSTDPRTLKKILKKRYGIDCTGKIEPDIKKIYHLTLECCQSLGGIDIEGATDQNFFPDILSNRDTHLFDYLATDALFHIRKEIAFQDKSPIHKSFNNFYDKLNGKFSKLGIEIGIPTLKTFRQYLEQLFSQNIFHDFLKISKGLDNSKRTKYEIPVFMDRLLLLLISTIRQNPYFAQSHTDLSDNLKLWFTENKLFDQVWHLYYKPKNYGENNQAKGNQWIANYLIDRTFDIDTLVYLTSKLALIPSVIEPQQTLSFWVPIFFIPNTFGKRAYCDLMLQVMQSPQKVITKLDLWKHSKKITKSTSSNSINLNTVSHNLKCCKQYLLFLSTVYLPLINNCFYVLLRKACRQEELKTSLKKADSLLMNYFNAKNICQTQTWKDKISKFTKTEKEFFAGMYAHRIEIISNWHK